MLIKRRSALEASEVDKEKLKAQLARLKQQMIREQVRRCRSYFIVYRVHCTAQARIHPDLICTVINSMFLQGPESLRWDWCM